jgi:hypothetical protein
MGVFGGVLKPRAVHLMSTFDHSYELVEFDQFIAEAMACGPEAEAMALYSIAEFDMLKIQHGQIPPVHM